MGDFFLQDNDMSSEGEAKNPVGSMEATEAMAQQMIKSKERASKNKEIMDFKVRALDFLSIYIKEKHYQQRPVIQIKLIRGLLQSLSVAHRDGHKALFDRIKQILSQMAKQGAKAGEESKVADGGLQECQVLMTEMMQMLLKQHRDQAIQQAYSDCFILLTKHFYDQESQEIRDFLSFSLKELLSKFFGGRIPATSALKQKLFERVFEQCPALGWSVIKTVLKCFLPKAKEAASEGSEKGDKD